MELQRNYILSLLLHSIFTLHMPNCVTVAQLYVKNLIFVSPVAANCSIVTLGNNFLYMYTGIIFQSLPMSTLYGTMFKNFIWWCFHICYYCGTIGIKFNRIDIYCFNVSFLFLVSFFLLQTSLLWELLYISFNDSFVASFTFLPIWQALSQFVAHTSVFAPSLCRCFNRHGWFCLYLLVLVFFSYYIKVLYLTQVVDNCCLGSLSFNSFCPD